MSNNKLNPNTNEVEPPPEVLSLKILRLKKVEGSVKFPVLFEKDEIFGKSISTQKTYYPEKSIYQENLDENTLVMDGLGYSESWKILEEFGKIHVHEKLRCYVTLSNQHSFSSAKNINFKASLITTSNTVGHVLLDFSKSPVPEIKPDSHHDFVIEHTITEAETHLLICDIEYLIEESVVKTQKKFKIPASGPVLQPIEIRWLCNSFPGTKNDICLQVELKNLMEHPIYIENLNFNPGTTYDVIDHSIHQTGKDYHHLLLSKEVKRYLFQILSKEKVSHVLGKIGMNWKTTMGESGELQTASISYKTLPKPEIEMTFLETIDEEIFIEKSFQIMCRIYNRSKTKVDLTIYFDVDAMFPLCVNGLSIKKIGFVDPNSKVDVKLDFFALGVGLQSLGKGMRIKDSFTAKVTRVNNLCELYVKE